MDMVKRFGVYWINLNPTIGAEMQKIRPAVVISPDVMNDNLKTVIIAPLTSTLRKYPFRINVELNGKEGQVALDHLRSIDKKRVGKSLGTLSEQESTDLINTITEMFKY